MNNPINYIDPLGLDTVGLTTDRTKPPIDPDKDLGLGGELPQININVGPTDSTVPTSSTSNPTANNSTSSDVAHPRVTWGPNANRNVVSQHSLNLLNQVMIRSGNMNLRITSTQRTPENQARAMYDNMRRYGPGINYNMYGPAGDRVTTVGVGAIRQGAGREEVLRRMIDEILLFRMLA